MDNLSEDDISVKYIIPALHKAGWDEDTQIRRQVSFTKGRIIVRGKLVSRGRPKKADFVLYYQHIPIALIEAKKSTFSAGHGMQQALDYAAALQTPFVFSSNGKGFVFHDRTGLWVKGERNLGMDAFPKPETLWSIYRLWKGLAPMQEKIVLQLYFDDGGKEPRYYQRNAINAANDLADRKHFGDIYKQLLNDLLSAGNAGEYYSYRHSVTPWRRPVRAYRPRRWKQHGVASRRHDGNPAFQRRVVTAPAAPLHRCGRYPIKLLKIINAGLPSRGRDATPCFLHRHCRDQRADLRRGATT